MHTCAHHSGEDDEKVRRERPSFPRADFIELDRVGLGFAATDKVGGWCLGPSGNLRHPRDLGGSITWGQLT